MIESSRRELLSAAAAAGLGILGPSSALAGRSPNDRVAFACIGVGGKGASDTAAAAANGDVVAICDVDEKTLAAAAAKYPNAKTYSDYRRMLDEMNRSIDAVTVSIPDHSHAPAAAHAMRMGKHVYCQKPLTHSIGEARALADIARRQRVATQMGNQGTANPEARRAAALVRAGALGAVSEVHVWTDRPIWPQGGERPAPAPKAAGLNWDLWLGPARARPFGDGYHPFKWRGYWDFGTGALGDMGCHLINMPYMALDLSNPVSARAEMTFTNRETYPTAATIRYRFASSGTRGPLEMVWYDGGRMPHADLVPGRKLGTNGIVIVGDRGTMFSEDAYGAGAKILGGVKVPEPDVAKSPGHFEELVAEIKGGPRAVSNFPDYAGPLTEMVLLGNLALWAQGEMVEWDRASMRAKSGVDLEPLIRPVYRRGFRL